MSAGLHLEAGLHDFAAEISGVPFQRVTQMGIGFKQVQHFQRGADDYRGHRIGEKVWP